MIQMEHNLEDFVVEGEMCWRGVVLFEQAALSFGGVTAERAESFNSPNETWCRH
tara:strand:+ start:234 stop:395 length:162 start_codon:yes stop_codon:yes gene_type:complete